MPKLLLPATKAAAEILAKMNLNILCAANSTGFITSDAPCVMFDEKVHACSNPKRTVVGLGYETAELTLPISPKLMAYFSWHHLPQNYINITDYWVDDINRRTQRFCHEYFIVNKNVKKKFGLNKNEILLNSID